MKQILLSVIIPVYNAEKYLITCLDSIKSQTYKNYEVIIIDDASTDDSQGIMKKYAKTDKRFRVYINNLNLRITKTLNKGIKIAKGKYILRMDADDWCYPERFEKQFKYMEKHPDIGVSGGTIEVCDKNLNIINKRKYPLSDSEVRKIIFRYSPFAHPATIWNAKLMKKIGGYNPNIPLSQDYELYFRIGNISKFGNIKDTILKLRTHDDSSSIIRGKFQEQYAIYTRIKAFLEFGYNMSFFDKFYTFVQMISMVIIPPKLKFWLFNFIRKMI